MYCETKEVDRTAYQAPDETKDEQAIRLRSAGMSFREIAGAMDIDVAMAHRRVKRALIRQRCEREERMQDVRDVELEKLRRIEKAILPEAFEGDQNAARLALRIMEMRRRMLKDHPLDEAHEDPWEDLMQDERSYGQDEDDPFAEDHPLERLAGEDTAQPSTEMATETAPSAESQVANDSSTTVPPGWMTLEESEESKNEFLATARQAHRESVTARYAALGLSPAEVAAKVDADCAQLERKIALITAKYPSTMASTDPSTDRSTVPSTEEPSHDALPPSASSPCTLGGVGCSSTNQSTHSARSTSNVGMQRCEDAKAQEKEESKVLACA